MPTAIMIMPMPTMMRKAKKGMMGFGRVIRRERFQAADLGVPIVRENEAAELRDRDLETVALGLRVGQREEDQRRPLLRLPMRLDRGDLGGLMLARVEAVHVADHELERREPDKDAQAHAEHDAAVRNAALAQRCTRRRCRRR